MSITTDTKTPLEAFLYEQDEQSWAAAINELLPSIHEVDRAATQIWFHFFPLALLRAFEQTADPAELERKLLMQGKYLLREQVDSSHTFLYGHRFWPAARREVVAEAGAQTPPAGASLAGLIRGVAERVAASRSVEVSLAIGITAVALMTLRQAGLAGLAKAPGAVHIDTGHAGRTPEQILKARARDDSQGLFGFLKTTDKTWTVVWDENREDRRFRMVHMQEVASGAATDKRDWSAVDPRCTIGEGPIPVQCRAASCGTCWVGVLGGADKLAEVAPRERRMMAEFGYSDTDDSQPLVRLSCQAQGRGAVSVVIPPWNGYFGKYLRRQKESAASVPAAGGGSEAVTTEA